MTTPSSRSSPITVVPPNPTPSGRYRRGAGTGGLFGLLQTRRKSRLTGSGRGRPMWAGPHLRQSQGTRAYGNRRAQRLRADAARPHRSPSRLSPSTDRARSICPRTDARRRGNGQSIGRTRRRRSLCPAARIRRSTRQAGSPRPTLGIGGQHCTFVLAGAGVKQGLALKRQVRAVDVAPTLCYLLGIPMPRTGGRRRDLRGTRRRGPWSSAMKAAYYCCGDRTVEIGECRVQSPSADQVRIEVAYCGVCGTDIHIYLGHQGPPHRHAPSHWARDVGTDRRGRRRRRRLGPWVDPVVVRPLEACGACAACNAGQWPHLPEPKLHRHRQSGGLPRVVDSASPHTAPPARRYVHDAGCSSRAASSCLPRRALRRGSAGRESRSDRRRPDRPAQCASGATRGSRGASGRGQRLSVAGGARAWDWKPFIHWKRTWSPTSKPGPRAARGPTQSSRFPARQPGPR